MQRSRNIIAPLFLVLSWLCVSSSPAWATGDTVVVDDSVGYYILYMRPGQPALLNFSAPIIGKTEPTGWDVKVAVHRTADAVTLFVPKGTAADKMTGPLTIETRRYTLIVLVQSAETADQVKSPILVKDKNSLAVTKAAAAQLAQSKIDAEKQRMDSAMAAKDAAHAEELTRVRAAHAKELKRAQKEHGESVLLKEVPSGYRRRTRLRGSRSCDEDKGVVICGKQWTPMDKYGVLQMLVTNRTKNDIDMRSITAHNEQGTRDHASMVRIGDNPPVPSSDIKNAKLVPGQSVPVSVSIRNPNSVGRQVKVVISMAGGIVPAFTTIDLDPEPEPGEGLITLGLQGIAGAVWLANPMEPSQLGATSTAGLALRVRYGFNKRLSFEGELAGARSGNASWSGMMYDNQEGVIDRDATVGRVLVGGLVHFGEKYRPLVRAGLGFQGVDHGSRFTPTGGAETDGPGVDFELAGLWMVGLGFEAKIGRHWTAGLGAMFVGVATSLGGEGSKGSFEGGLNLSYGWTPGY